MANAGWQLFTSLLQQLPTTCIVCGRHCCTAYSLCMACEQELPWIGSACLRCGMPCAESRLTGDQCGACLLHPPPFRACHSLFHYRPPVSGLLSHYKFGGRLETGHALACLLAERLQACLARAPAPDLLLPVPLHKHRLARRGFNQSLEIARVVARRCAIPLARDLVRREGSKIPQTAMASARLRQKNVRQAFVVDGERLRDSVTRIAIIDDVVTTTATVAELTRALQSHGIRDVQVWSLARAGEI